MSKASRARELAGRNGQPWSGSAAEVAKRQSAALQALQYHQRTPAGRRATSLLLAVSTLTTSLR